MTCTSDHAHIKAHPFFSGIDWNTLRTAKPPPLAAPLVPIYVDEEKERKIKAQEAKNSIWGKFLFKNSDEVIVQTGTDTCLGREDMAARTGSLVQIRNRSFVMAWSCVSRRCCEDQQAFLWGHQVTEEPAAHPYGLSPPVLCRHR